MQVDWLCDGCESSAGTVFGLSAVIRWDALGQGTKSLRTRQITRVRIEPGFMIDCHGMSILSFEVALRCELELCRDVITF